MPTLHPVHHTAGALQDEQASMLADGGASAAAGGGEAAHVDASTYQKNFTITKVNDKRVGFFFFPVCSVGLGVPLHRLC